MLELCKTNSSTTANVPSLYLPITTHAIVATLKSIPKNIWGGISLMGCRCTFLSKFHTALLPAVKKVPNISCLYWSAVIVFLASSTDSFEIIPCSKVVNCHDLYIGFLPNPKRNLEYKWLYPFGVDVSNALALWSNNIGVITSSKNPSLM